MTLPKEVADSLAEIAGEAECRCDVAYTSRGLKDPTCNHDLAESVEIIRAHLLSQDATMDNLRSALQKMVLANADLRAHAAASDALLRSIAAYAPPEHECVHGCTVTMCEACKLADYLRGPTHDRA